VYLDKKESFVSGFRKLRTGQLFLILLRKFVFLALSWRFLNSFAKGSGV
jgi:hypothetical protein